MLSIGSLTTGRVEYYLASVGRGADDYYLGRGEAPGRWVGGAADSLGLSGRVGEADFRDLLDGRAPGSEQRLGHARADRTLGFDLCFRAPKSVSLVYALTGFETSREVTRAHDTAVAAALDYLERHAAFARRGRNGLRQIETTGLVAAAFRHRTSRAGDPHVHTHVVVANVCRGVDGRWGALDGRLLYHHAKTAGYLYEAQLRADLTRRLGVAWGPVRNGIADIDGIPKPILRAFSRRSAEKEAHMASRGEHSARAAQLAVLATRRAKHHHVEAAQLFSTWHARAAELGIDPASIADLLDRAAPQPVDAARERALITHLLGPEGLTARASTFDRRDVLCAISNAIRPGAEITAIEGLADKLLEDADVVTLDATDRGGRATIRRADGRRVPIVDDAARYSTRELLAIEARLLAAAREGVGAGLGIASPSALAEALACRPALSYEQTALVASLVSSGNGIDVVVAPAGAGKTFTLDAARDAWQRSGYRVVGATLAARAARQLESTAGISSDTIARLLIELEREDLRPLDRAAVLVVDEAGMVGTRTLARLVDHSAAAGAKVVLVGDPGQLPEIDAGGALAGLADRLDPLHLRTNRRQREAWERDALLAWRDGAIDAALDAYQHHGRVVTAATAIDVRQAMITEWWAARRAGEPAVMVAARRADVDDLNVRARAVIEAAEGVSGPTLVVGERPYQAGDRVMTLRNDRRHGVRNGETATITAVDLGNRSIALRTDHNTAVTLPTGYLDAGNIAHAYATTIHKAQGLTTERALVLGTDDLYRESGYVAMSRGTATNTIFVVDPEPDPEAHGRAPEPEDPVQRLARHLEVSRAQELAIEALDAQSLTRSLVALHRERAELVDRDQGSGGYAKSLDRLIAGQLHGLVEARTLDPPAYLVDELGAFPDTTTGHDHWRDGARAIESYRCANRITDPAHALGPMPKEPERVREWQEAHRQAWDAARTLRARDRMKKLLGAARSPEPKTPAPDLAPSLGHELGIDL
jgi:conjugative relaxase-like TrwC/TraI family protein